MMRAFIIAGALIAAVPAAASAKPAEDHPATYYPHWAARDGSITPQVMSRLPRGTIIGAHHSWSLAELRRILDHRKRFRIAWYVEANVATSEDPTAPGTPVATRIAEARAKQQALVRAYGRDRFTNLIELDAARDKKDGELSGEGNSRADWLADAAAAKAAGFAYIAKSPTVAQVRELRARLGRDFVPRIVYEDVTASPDATNPGYRRDARTMARRGESVTLIVHEGEYGGFQGTPLDRARSVVLSDFDLPNVEAYWGRTYDAVKLKSFAGTENSPDSTSRE